MPATTPPVEPHLSRISLERPLEGPCLTFDLPHELARLQVEETYQRTGHNARTLAKYADTRIVLTALRRGARVKTHETDERIAIQCLVGRVRLWLPYGTSEEVGEGGLGVLDRGLAHELEALEDCAFLLTVTWARPADQSGRAPAGRARRAGRRGG